jgi:hypothetical protein
MPDALLSSGRSVTAGFVSKRFCHDRMILGRFQLSWRGWRWCQFALSSAFILLRGCPPDNQSDRRSTFQTSPVTPCKLRKVLMLKRMFMFLFSGSKLRFVFHCRLKTNTLLMEDDAPRDLYQRPSWDPILSPFHPSPTVTTDFCKINLVVILVHFQYVSPPKFCVHSLFPPFQ